MKTFFDILRDNRGFANAAEDEEEEDMIDVGEEEGGEDGAGVEIDLDEEEDDGKQTPADKAFAAMRVENKELKKTVDELKKTVESLQHVDDDTPQYQAPKPESTTYDPNNPRTWTEDKWDELAKKDWKKAVDLRSQIQAEERIAASSQTAEFNRVLEESKQEVLRRHPELNDPNSEKAKIFRNIVVANPEYTNQRKGPLNAMYEMEDYMEKNMGYKREDIVKAERRAREEEAGRLNRVQLTSTTGHNISEGNKVVIAKDELEFCKLHGIDPKVYATNKQKLAKAGKGGIQL